MYDPWVKADPSAEAIIKLIEEREREEVKYSPHENQPSNWSIVSLKDALVNAKDRSRHPVEHESSFSYRQGRPEHSDYSDSKASWESTHRELVPARSWGKVTESLNKQLRAEIETREWKVRKHSCSSDERVESRSKRRGEIHNEPSIKRVRKYYRSRSGSGDERRRRCQSRSRSSSRDKNRRSNSRDGKYDSIHSRDKRNRSSRDRKRDKSGSRDMKRYRSVSKEKKHNKGNSRNRKHQRSGSSDRKRDRSDRQRSHSIDTDSDRKSEPLPRTHSPLRGVNQLAENPATVVETTTEILSKLVSIMSGVKEKSVEKVVHKVSYDNVLPEFDPSNNGHAILTWLIRVDDVAKLFGWEEKEIIQYALPKLVGDAKTWYQTLTIVPYSWADWKKTLLEQFPCPHFVKLLNEMTKKKKLITETLEQYYYAKIVLINRCGFKGRQAVDCLVQGIKDQTIRLCAMAAQFGEPEELLMYFKTADSLRQNEKKFTENGPTITNQCGNASTTLRATKTLVQKTNPTCFHCGIKGHKQTQCFKIRQDKVSTPSQIQNKMHPKTYKPPNQGHPHAFQPNQEYEGSQKFLTKNQKQLHRKCFNCGTRGHVALKCPLLNNIQPDQGSMSNSAVAPQAASEYTEPAPPGLEDEY